MAQVVGSHASQRQQAGTRGQYGVTLRSKGGSARLTLQRDPRCGPHPILVPALATQLY